MASEMLFKRNTLLRNPPPPGQENQNKISTAGSRMVNPARRAYLLRIPNLQRLDPAFQSTESPARRRLLSLQTQDMHHLPRRLPRQ